MRNVKLIKNNRASIIQIRYDTLRRGILIRILVTSRNYGLHRLLFININSFDLIILIFSNI